MGMQGKATGIWSSLQLKLMEHYGHGEENDYGCLGQW